MTVRRTCCALLDVALADLALLEAMRIDWDLKFVADVPSPWGLESVSCWESGVY